MLNRKLQILLHISLWLLMFGIFPLLIYIDSMYDSLYLKRSIFQAAIFLILFYSNYFILIPKLFFRKKHIEYFSFFIGLILVSVFLFIKFESYNHNKINSFKNHQLLHNSKSSPEFDKTPPLPPINFNSLNMNKMHLKGPKPSKRWPTYNFLLMSFLISGLSFGLRMSEKLILNERLRKETEREKLNSELAFLKNQISPHFFFNTLNNIYSLVEINTAEGQKAILQLSKLMRYLLYESENGNTLLSREIEFMTNFVELMKLRLSPKVQLKVKFPKKYEDIEIPPLLFISFIENAFKHGISYKDPSFINIDMSVNAKDICFWCSNSLIGKSTNEIKTASGIGLENVKKRLELLFPDKHNLVIHSTEVFYSIMLTIDISIKKS
jgi:two-component system LytT family sensor kinase